MPENLKALRRRIRSVKNTRQITRAMEMVSASKLKRTETALLAAMPYNERLAAMLLRLVASGSAPEGHSLFRTTDVVKTRLVVAFGGDRGLCGAYNAHIQKASTAYVEASQAAGIKIRALPVGKRMCDFFRKKISGVEIAREIPEHNGMVSVELAKKISDCALEEFEAERVDEVVFLYNGFVSTSKYEETREKFLPFDIEALAGEDDEPTEGDPSAVEYIYEPGRDRVFDSLIPRFIQSKVYVAIASAITSEHSARMIAMNNATKNCGELIDQLTLRMNKARQAQITTEIIEIVSGAEAIQA